MACFLYKTISARRCTDTLIAYAVFCLPFDLNATAATTTTITTITAATYRYVLVELLLGGVGEGAIVVTVETELTFEEVPVEVVLLLDGAGDSNIQSTGLKNTVFTIVVELGCCHVSANL